MIRVYYDTEHQRGTLKCLVCGASPDLPGLFDVMPPTHGATTTFPNALDVVRAHIEMCPKAFAIRGATPWEAVLKQTGEVLASGQVIVDVDGNFVLSPRVVQDEPTP